MLGLFHIWINLILANIFIEANIILHFTSK